MNFSEAMFYENYLTSDFHTNTVISRRVCLLVKMASKTAIRPIDDLPTVSCDASFSPFLFRIKVAKNLSVNYILDYADRC